MLDSIFGHLLYYIEEEFISKFGRLSPSVSGVNEALERIKHLKTGAWGTTAQLDADFENMYSNCHKDLLKLHVRHAAELAGFSEDTIQYIFNLIHMNMEHSYFKEPHGIFHTTKGYSMGDMSASKGSEVILRDSELGTFTALKSRDLLDKVDDYFRFKDDIHAHPDGTFNQVLDAIHIIATTYPPEIQLNMEINIFQGKFLNLRLYNQIDTNNMYTTILRKKNSKYTAKRSQLKHHLHRINYHTANVHMITDADLENVFNLEDGRIIVESDKKLGFVILDTHVYTEAYNKINLEQHFVKSDITEEWYIKNIVDYVKEAGAPIPVELSKIIKPSDFENSIEYPSLGHLRLLPKIQKLTKVDHSEVDRLRCRGIKSSLQDPLRSSRKCWTLSSATCSII